MTFQDFFQTATGHPPYDYQSRLAGELPRPFGPVQITFQFGLVVGTLDAPLGQEGLEPRTRHAGKFGRLAKRKQAARIQSQRHLLRYFRLRRLRRQEDFLQNTVGNFNCQRHAKTITSSAKANKTSRGPRPCGRGTCRFSSGNSHQTPASTRPRPSGRGIIEPFGVKTESVTSGGASSPMPSFYQKAALVPRIATLNSPLDSGTVLCASKHNWRKLGCHRFAITIRYELNVAYFFDFSPFLHARDENTVSKYRQSFSFHSYQSPES